MPTYYKPRWYPMNQTQAATVSATSPTWVTGVVTATGSTAIWYVQQWIDVDQTDWNHQARSQSNTCRRPIPLTPEQVSAANIQRAEQVRLAKERDDAKNAATKRARDLLLEHLTPAQRRTFEEHKWFIVTGGKSGTKYRIRDAGHFVANIDVFEGKNTITHRLCAHVPTDQVPVGDNLLAQKMMIEYDEERFVRTANRHA